MMTLQHINLQGRGVDGRVRVVKHAQPLIAPAAHDQFGTLRVQGGTGYRARDSLVELELFDEGGRVSIIKIHAVGRRDQDHALLGVRGVLYRCDGRGVLSVVVVGR